MASLLGRINEETPKFDLLKKGSGGYEIRRYHRQIRASVTFDDTSGEGATTQQGFRDLAGYIFGGNSARTGEDSGASIAMTAPVLTGSGSGSGSGTARTITMSFVLPAKYGRVEDLPVPTDKSVRLEVADVHTVAALRFSGRWTPEVTAVQSRRLREMLLEDGDVELVIGSAAAGAVPEPIVARYNPPWTPPFLRTNEVMFPVRFTPSEG